MTEIPCINCEEPIRYAGNADPSTPWVHEATGNIFCDVACTEDAVWFAGTPGRKVATPPTIQQRLEYLRGEIEAGRISYGELAELQSLADHIDPGDVELLQWAGVPESTDHIPND